MAWRFGKRGHGWYRTNRIFDHDGQQRIPALIDQLRSAANNPAEFWQVLKGAHGLRGLGSAFGTKLAYFANYRAQPANGPLIADRWTAWTYPPRAADRRRHLDLTRLPPPPTPTIPVPIDPIEFETMTPPARQAA